MYILCYHSVKADLQTEIRAKNDLGSRRHSAVTASTPDFETCSGSNAAHADSDSSSNNRSMLQHITAGIIAIISSTAGNMPSDQHRIDIDHMT